MTTRRAPRLGARRSALLLVMIPLVFGGCGSSPSPSPLPQPVAAVTAAPTLTPTPSPTPTPTPSPSPSPTPTPSIVPADLTGNLVALGLAHRTPLAVLIDDARVARPQSGFNGASIVYQAPADGYETRYLMVFQEGESKDVGPVRSARLYFAQWAAEVRAAVGHYGGDRKTRAFLKRYHGALFTNVDALGAGSKAYHRVKGRRAPHNGYTSTASLRKIANRLGLPAELAAEIYRRSFIAPSPEAQRGASQSIRIPYNTVVINYTFDRATDMYLRKLGNKAHIDPADGRQVTARNVVVLFQKFRIDTKIEPGHARPDLTVIGEGRALFFREGKVVEGTWRKKTPGSPTLYLAADGSEIKLVTGRTFVQAVPTTTKVTFGN